MGAFCVQLGEGENVVLQRYKGDEMAKAAIFSLVLQKEEGLKGALLSRKGLNKEIWVVL